MREARARGASVVVVVALLAALCPSTFAEETQTSATRLFRVTPRSPAEKFFLVEAEKSPIDPTNPNLGLGRVAFPGGHFTYRIPLTDVSTCTLNMEIGNRYKISASVDNSTWKTLAEVKNVSGLSNYGTYPFDLTPLLPADNVYVKFEDSQNKGWGCWLRSVTVLTDRSSIRPVMTLDATGRQPLKFNLASVLSKGTKTTSPRNPTSVEMTLDGSVLRGKIACSYPAGYTPVSVAKTRDGEVYRDDCVELFIATADRPSEYRHFVINSANVQFDELVRDVSSDWEWESRTVSGETGWLAEFAIDLQKTGLMVPKGDSLLLCVSRLDGNSGQVAVVSPFARWGLHQPDQWAKVALGDRSAAVPAMDYDAEAEVIRRAKTALGERVLFMVMDQQSNAVFADAIDPGKAYSHELKFKEPGSYRIYGYTESGLSSVSTLSVDEEVVEKFVAEAVAPIFYVGEKVTISYSTPERAKGSRVRVAISSGDKPVNVGIRDTEGRIRIEGLPRGEYTAELSVGEENEIKPVTLRFAIKERATVPEKVEITSAGFVEVDGKPFVPIMVHIPQNLADVKAKGFNVVVTGNDNPRDPEWIKLNRKTLDNADRAGLKVLLHLCNLLRGDNEDYESLKLAVSSLKNHPAVFGWFTADEPSGNVFDVKKLEKAYKVVKAIDNDHPVVVLDNVPIMLKTYAPYCDILSSDPYPVPNSPLETVKDWTAATFKASQNKCIYMVLQGQGPPYYSRQPTFEEQRVMLGHALKGGAKCIGWWAHGAMAASGYWDRYGELTTMARDFIENAAKEARSR